MRKEIQEEEDDDDDDKTRTKEQHETSHQYMDGLVVWTTTTIDE